MRMRHDNGDSTQAIAIAMACMCVLACMSGCPTTPVTPTTDADFMAWPASGTAPLAVQFVDLSFTVPGQTVQRWWWDFGDSGIDAVQDPMHEFTRAGTYDVKLIIDTVDAHGNTETLHPQIIKTQFITVTAPGANPADQVAPGEMTTVEAAGFDMGATDAEGGASNEYPRHHVTLSKYDIGKFEVTNKEYADALNALLAADQLYNSSGKAYAGGDVYGHGQLLSGVSSGYCQIAFAQNRFVPKVRDGRSMENHPVVMVTWYGAVVFCNQLSESKGIAPYYDPATWVPTTSGMYGYRLPTESEWERAAAWGVSHWVYGFSSNLIDFSRCTYAVTETGQAAYYPNPVGLKSVPYTTPIGYYNAANGTANRRSPVRCYDMSGNVQEWCADRYGLYTADEHTNPQGAASGDTRVVRGGSWFDDADACRTAHRTDMMPDRMFMFLGFRTARTL